MQKSGFTLLELSIVLVIIGLIIGGVTVGGALIRQAELQSIGKDLQRLETEISTFKLKYSYLPGDLPNAYQYWPSEPSTTNANVCNTWSGLNGNGDGYIAWKPWINTGEDSRAPHHLTLAGMTASPVASSNGVLVGTYSTSGVIWGVTNMRSRINGVGYGLESTLETISCSSPVNTPMYGRVGNQIKVASRGETNGSTGDSGKMLHGGAMNAQEANALESKLDDSKTNSGKIIAENAGGSATCLGSGGAYDVTQTVQSCMLYWWL